MAFTLCVSASKEAEAYVFWPSGFTLEDFGGPPVPSSTSFQGPCSTVGSGAGFHPSWFYISPLPAALLVWAPPPLPLA